MFEKPHGKAQRARAVAGTIPGVTVASEWVTPQTYADDDVEAGRLPCLKGMTCVELPTLEPTDAPPRGVPRAFAPIKQKPRLSHVHS